MIVQRFDNEDALASTLAARLVDAIVRNPRVVLGLPTGRTPLPLYRALRDLTKRSFVDWSAVRTFNLDEFAGLGRDDPGSYRAFMQEAFFDHIPIDPANVDMLNGRAPELAAECLRYEKAIADAGGIDIQILGIGANGHIGFNEPADELHAHTHVATLQRATLEANAMLFGGDPERVPKCALSMGMGTILAARQIVMIALGEEKSDCVAGMVNDLITTRLPASFLQVHAHATVMLDHAAASKLAAD